MKSPLTPLDPWIAGKLGGPERLTGAAIEAYQLRQLRATLSLARERSRFYRQHLADAPQEINSLPDLARFPFTTARDIRDQALSFLCVSQDEIQRVVTLDTSGTTGAPKRLYFTRDDQELTIDFFQVGMSTFTYPGDRVLILLPGERPGSVGDLLALGLQRLNARPIKHGPVKDISQTLDVLQREKADGLVGIPTQVLALARHRPGLKLKTVLLSTDHVPEAVRRAIGQAWDCRVYNHYGMTEMGLGGGVECGAQRGYHLREADLYFEIVDPASGEPIPEGETGEVVFTTLTRRGMPLIRYRTGDLSRFVPGACPCGTALKTLEWIRRRLDGLLAVGSGGSLAMADLDEALFALDGVLDFSASMAQSGSKDSLNLTVTALEGTGAFLGPAIEAALEAIPSVRAARAAGQLEVVVTVQSGGGLAARPFKRQIVDQRAGAQRG
jgi:phenylacetate-coenzyme A ligase PaaK-like adenylate-forming protein